MTTSRQEVNGSLDGDLNRLNPDGLGSQLLKDEHDCLANVRERLLFRPSLADGGGDLETLYNVPAIFARLQGHMIVSLICLRGVISVASRIQFYGEGIVADPYRRSFSIYDLGLGERPTMAGVRT